MTVTFYRVVINLVRHIFSQIVGMCVVIIMWLIPSSVGVLACMAAFFLLVDNPNSREPLLLSVAILSCAALMAGALMIVWVFRKEYTYFLEELDEYLLRNRWGVLNSFDGGTYLREEAIQKYEKKATLRSVAAVLIGLGIMYGWGSFSPIKHSSIQVEQASIDDIPGMLASCKGRKAVMVLFSSQCGYCQKYVPDLIETARDKEYVPILLSLDRNRNNLENFLQRKEIDEKVFLIDPYPAGALSRAVATISVEIGKTFTTPLVAVFDKNGRFLRQEEASINIDLLLID